jgi:hypothetical protein
MLLKATYNDKHVFENYIKWQIQYKTYMPHTKYNIHLELEDDGYNNTTIIRKYNGEQKHCKP